MLTDLDGYLIAWAAAWAFCVILLFRNGGLRP
jgi:hypothetical protein